MAKQEETHRSLFDKDDFLKCNKEWQDMPEFVNADLSPFQSVIVHFETKEAQKAFAKLVEQNITNRTKSIWFPKADLDIVKNERWADSKRKKK